MKAAKSFRRLAADHRSLLTAGLPPNYLFPPNADDSDLTTLDVLLAGPTGTPYANGVWRLHLDIPPTFPNAPPTATFRTRLWHPNIDEATGAVCVETLKRDWSSSLKLRDVLVTISCLLIQPNPASALNEAAGKLASEDWEGFCRRAKLMTDIHAAVPKDIADSVREAQSRGEEAQPVDDKTVASESSKEPKKPTTTSAKVQQSSVDDEENQKRQGKTIDLDSDPESDWIPGPFKTPKTTVAGVHKDNIFGIKGLETGSGFDTSPSSIIPTRSQAFGENSENRSEDVSSSFTPTSAKRVDQHSFTLRTPRKLPENWLAGSPELVDQFSATEDKAQSHPLLNEFSWSWEESEILHDTGTIKNGTTKADVRKRMASDDFEKKRQWEMKRFKDAGYDLNRYNRGDFGPRTGIARL